MRPPKILVVFGFLTFCIARCQGKITPIDLPDKFYNCFNTLSKKSFYKSRPAEELSITCLQNYMWKDVGVPCTKLSSTQQEYMRGLLKPLLTKRTKRQTAPLRVRKEYRSLSSEEREIYHNAITALKHPDELGFDTIAGFHQGDVASNAHGGPAFLPWHRIFLLMYENALVNVSNGRLTALPYIDWRLDARLANDTDSILWRDDHLGNVNGVVNSGPFANWLIPPSAQINANQPALTRNWREGGSLINDNGYNAVMNLLSTNEEFNNNLESEHNSVHVYIGGQMSFVAGASFDPVFYMHHAFIDYAWWRFQTLGGTDRFYTYPDTSQVGHRPNDPMLNMNISGQSFNNADGYTRSWTTEFFTYELSPADCNQNCNQFTTDSLNCDAARCISRTRGENGNGGNGGSSTTASSSTTPIPSTTTSSSTTTVPSIPSSSATPTSSTTPDFYDYYYYYYDYPGIFPGRKRRDTSKMSSTKPLAKHQDKTKTRSTKPSSKLTDTSKMSATKVSANLKPKHNKTSQFSSPSCLGKPIQNLYIINCKSDSSLWGYIPIKIVHVRTNDIIYNSFPVHKGKYQTSNDIYYHLPTSKIINNFTKPGNPIQYEKCPTDQSGAFRVTVGSYGLNYFGEYRDYVILDNRQPLSSAMTYIGVRKPTKLSSRVYLAAFDRCGRSCTPKCLIPGSSPPRYVTCTGALNIDKKRPLGYGSTYDDAVLLYYRFRSGSDCPETVEKNVPVIFYCKQSDNWLPFHKNKQMYT